jgi:hypothetical protein
MLRVIDSQGMGQLPAGSEHDAAAIEEFVDRQSSRRRCDCTRMWLTVGRTRGDLIEVQRELLLSQRSTRGYINSSRL